MKKQSSLIFLLFFLVSNISRAQQINTEETSQSGITHRTCGTETPQAEWDAWFNEQVEIFKQQSANKTQASYVIPVVIHLIHGGQAVGTFPNISQVQVNSQITVLNQDYSGTGLNVGNVPSAFSTLISNTNVQFCMATKNPQGSTMTEPGIDRISYVTKSWSNPTSFTTTTNFRTFMDGTVKPNTIWDPTKYMNIWICDRSSQTGLLGYATFPAGSTLTGLSGTGTATTDGFWCWTKSFGNTGTLDPTYNKGRTATHEIGHWLGLRHIWGDGTCATDYCTDTPPAQSSNFGCPTHPHKTGTCSGNTTGEMTMNFMDYTDDPCMYMFSPDQRTRIQTAMANGTHRKLLGTHGLCATTGITDNTLENGISIFPVPAHNTITIKLELNSTQDLMFTVFNSLGQEVFQKSEKNIQNTNIELNLSAYEKGFYFLRISDGTSNIDRKIILE